LSEIDEALLEIEMLILAINSHMKP